MPTSPLAAKRERNDPASPLKNVAPLQKRTPALMTARREMRSANTPRGKLAKERTTVNTVAKLPS